jgi:hydrogenase expression/formation protein HypC
MCLAIPGKIISVNNNDSGLKMAKVNFAGVKKDICVEWLNEPKVGEYVLVHVGFALSKIDQQDAEETLDILRQMGDIPEIEQSEDVQ